MKDNGKIMVKNVSILKEGDLILWNQVAWFNYEWKRQNVCQKI